jgi:hypothetical protein
MTIFARSNVASEGCRALAKRRRAKEISFRKNCSELLGRPAPRHSSTSLKNVAVPLTGRLVTLIRPLVVSIPLDQFVPSVAQSSTHGPARFVAVCRCSPAGLNQRGDETKQGSRVVAAGKSGFIIVLGGYCLRRKKPALLSIVGLNT